MKKTKTRLFNGNPMAYWEEQARELVVDALVRAGARYAGNENCLPQSIASKQLMSLAQGISESLFRKTIEERDRCKAGMRNILSSILKPKRKRRPAKKA